MKVLAINSSPRSAKESYTVKMLNFLIEGMREEGADVEVVNLREKKIRYCIGCFTCWTKTPGRCVHKDDMSRELFPKWLAADLVVYATPLYYHTINAALSTFMERTLPVLMPFFEKGSNGKTRHPLRHKAPPSVLLTVCGFPEASEFDALKDFFARTQHEDSKGIAIIGRAGASLLASPALERKANDVLDATRQAGRELIRSLEIMPETMQRMTQPLGDVESFARMGNMFWRTCIDEEVTPKQFDERNMVPRPRTLDDFMMILTYGLNAGMVTGRKVLLQFKFSGAVNDACYFAVADGRVDPVAGTCDNPDLIIETPFDLWMDIMTRKADGAQMLMENKYRVQGDLALMLQLFKTEDKAAGVHQ